MPTDSRPDEQDALRQLASYFEQQAYAYRRYASDTPRPDLNRVYLGVASAYEHAVIMVRAYQRLGDSHAA